MNLLRIKKVEGDFWQIVEQTWRGNSIGVLFKASNRVEIISYEHPDNCISTIYLRGTDLTRDFAKFTADKRYFKAIKEFCEAYEWRLEICI